LRHDDDAVRHHHSLVDVVRNKDNRLLRLLPDAQDLALHRAPGQCVERRERFVHQQYLRVDGERAGDFEALAHAAREFARIMAREAVELYQPQQFGDGIGHRAVAAVGT